MSIVRENIETINNKLKNNPGLLKDITKLIVPRMTNYIPHKPTVKQTAFLLLNQKESFYGGAAGGGKSDALLMAALQYVDMPGYSAIIFRRTFKDLALPGGLIDRAHEWLGPMDAKWIERDKCWTFPSGAKLAFGYIEHEKDKYNYQSTEFQFIGFDELSQFPESVYVYLFSRLRRLEGCDIPLRVRSASNPGGMGHKWVRGRFVQGGNTKDRIFIPAKMDDNPFLDQASYRESLSELPPDIRKQLEDGDWSDPYPEGSYYEKQLTFARKEGRVTHVPWEPRLPVDTWWDIGVGDSTAIWFTQSVGREIHLIDYYDAEGEGMSFYIRALRERPYVYGEHHGPHDIEVREFGSGLSRLEQARSLGFNFRVVKKQTFEDGINAAREIFGKCWFDEKKCADGLNGLANYHKQWDSKIGEYKNSPVHDWSSHPADAFRYFALGYNTRRKEVSVRKNKANIDFNIFN